jgi:hypothetical protein
MLLILRDEDIETVGSAIAAIAADGGLAPVEQDAGAPNLLALAASLLGPRVVLTAGEDFVLVEGLDSLDMGDAAKWGEALSDACGNEIVAIAPTASGIRVLLFDDGERGAEVDVDLDPSGTTRCPALAEIAPSDEAAEAIDAGLEAINAVELALHVVRLFDAGEDRRIGEPHIIAFDDPDEDDA